MVNNTYANSKNEFHKLFTILDQRVQDLEGVENTKGISHVFTIIKQSIKGDIAKRRIVGGLHSFFQNYKTERMKGNPGEKDDA